MNGRGLLLLMMGATLLAAAGGAAAALVLRDRPADDVDRAVLERLDRLDTAIADTHSMLAEGRDEVAGLRRRLQAAESALHPGSALRAADPAGPGARPGRVNLAEHAAPDDAATGDPGADDARSALKDRLRTLQLEAGDLAATEATRIALADGALRVLGDELGGLTKSLELRRLTEEERWQRARDEVGLNDMQVQELRRAVEERDAALRDALVVERDEATDTGRVTVKRSDPEKTKAAQQAYRDRVDDVLNDQQKESWKSGGFDRAFGSGGHGSGVRIVSIGTSHEVVEPADR